MSALVAAAMLLGAPVAQTHAAELQHRGHRVAATYRARVGVVHRQLGNPAPGGRPATLRCAWTARTIADREAVSAAGHVVRRTIAHPAAIEGSRDGWCTGQHRAIAADVAKRVNARDHLTEIADGDRAAMVAELDAAHAAAGG